jgi:hypothetical protein
LLQAMAQHGDLIAEAYFNGSVQSGGDNQRALNQLKQLKILSHRGQEGYRLSTRLSQFIDGALNSDRMRRLDTDLGGWVDLLEQQIGLYQDAHAEDRLEDGDHFLGEIERLVFDLADTLDENTTYLLMLVNSRFANVRALSEKKRQNAFSQIDYFTFNNIKGRSGRMFEHFVGHVYLFNEPPTEQLPFVDFPLFTQDHETPDSLLVQIEDEDLAPYSRERMQEYHNQKILPISVLRENSSIDPDAQIRLAEYLLEAPDHWSQALSWSQFPTSPQMEVICDLIWSFLAQVTRSRGGVFSARQLAFKVWQMLRVPNTAERVRQELRPGQYAAKTPDEAVERVLEFERTWASFELPRYLMALSRIQRAIFEPRGLPFGDYSSFASQVECYFKNPVAAALDEYGIPIQVGTKITEALGETEDLDTALAMLKKLRLENLNLDEFEKDLLSDAKVFLA